MIRIALFSLSMAGAPAALADVPHVATDIPPVTSLVAQVMGDLGAPTAFLPANADPHHVTLRPSEAQALSDADLIVWVGGTLMPGVGDALANLAGDTPILTLSTLAETRRLTVRDRSDFAMGAEEHAAQGDEEAHEHEHEHDDHATGADDDHAQVHGDIDAHMWLSPRNGALWLEAIARELARLDPGNAATYAANAMAARERLDETVAAARAELATLDRRDIAVDHDAFQYFEDAFDLRAVLTVTTSDDTEPGPRELAAIQTRLQAAGIACLLVESPGSAAQLRDLGGQDFGFVLGDVMGTQLDVPMADLYPAILSGMARDLAACGR